MIRRFLIMVLLLALLPLAAPTAAQDDPPTAQRVEVQAADGLVLVGDYYAPPAAAAEETGAPAALLMHMLGMDRTTWTPLITPLIEAGYAVLAVDLRGHGETGGSQDWPLAEGDTQSWIDWLRVQPGLDPEHVSLIGASIGGNLALRGMANDDRIVTAVALSPGLDYRGVTTEDAVQTINRRPVCLVAAQADTPSAQAVRALLQVALGDVLVRVYPGSEHGTNLFATQPDLIPLIVNWLEVHNR